METCKYMYIDAITINDEYSASSRKVARVTNMQKSLTHVHIHEVNN